MNELLKTPSRKALAFAIATGAVAILVLLLIYFGLAFGFVLAAIAALGVVGYRIHSQRLEQKVTEISEASRIHLATVEALATAIDARGQVGIGHVRRTQIYAVGIGRLLGLSESDINALRTGALLHDIGKLAVPDHILNKPEELTPAEFEKTKTHSAIGASILGKVGFPYGVVPTVRHHHERWDGMGYPDGLKGEKIPLTARILTVADAFDTLRGARPYRPALPREEARQIIQNEAGSRFDPEIVDLLVRNLSKLEAEIDACGHGYGEVGELRTVEKHGYVEQIKQANREVFSLYELAREFSASEDLSEILALFVTKIGEFVPFDTCAVYLLDETKRSATAAYVGGEYANELRDRRVRVGQGATGFALKELKTVQNVEPDLDFAYSQAELTNLYSTLASVPLIDDNDPVGAVTIYSLELKEYGDEHIRLLQTIARIAADAIGKSLKHDEVRTHAMTDPMTGLANARSLQAQFDKEVARASRTGTFFQLLMLDLDGFKSVNDTFGHKAGDAMLREISRVIQGELRDYDFLARYGGDEFVAIIPETSPADVADLCDRIERAVADFTLPCGDQIASVGVSLGAASFPGSGDSFDQLIVAADKAMYERKSRRKRVIEPQISNDRRSAALQVEHPDIFRISNDVSEDSALIVELDESHVVSTAVN